MFLSSSTAHSQTSLGSSSKLSDVQKHRYYLRSCKLRSRSRGKESDDSTKCDPSELEHDEPSTSYEVQSEDDGKDRSKDDGHYEFIPGQKIRKRYRVSRLLGDGTFGRVLECYDHTTGQDVAIKVIRSVERYVEAAKFEADIIKKIHEFEGVGSNRCISLQASFKFNRNYCLVFPKCGMSLYEFLKKNKFQGFSIQDLQVLTRQILEGLSFLHAQKLTHTDLKPENILLISDEAEALSNPSQFPLQVRRNAKLLNRYLKLKTKDIVLIDFGGATFEEEHHSSVINTRQYRAPEVLLGKTAQQKKQCNHKQSTNKINCLGCQEWDESSDMWSLGCILAELYSGELFFPTHENYEHLAMMEKAFGAIPHAMGEHANDETSCYFSNNPRMIKKSGSSFVWPDFASDKRSIARVAAMKTLEDIIEPEHQSFRDLIHEMMQFDPSERITAEEALDHPFFDEKFA